MSTSPFLNILAAVSLSKVSVVSKNSLKNKLKKNKSKACVARTEFSIRYRLSEDGESKNVTLEFSGEQADTLAAV